MKLREKTLIIIGIAVVCTLIIMFAASNVYIFQGFETLEKENTVKSVELASNSISNEISDLNGLLYDWAVWDDTYKFIQDNNSAYKKSNLVDSTFSNLKLNFIIFVDKKGNIVYADGYDLNNNEHIPIPEELENNITNGNVLLNLNKTGGSSGIIMLNDGPVLISARPILTTDEKGPAQGTLIFGRKLDNSLINELSKKTQLSISISSLNNLKSSDFKNAIDSINEASPIFVNPLNNRFIAGYTIINDLYGKPAFILKTENDRGFFEEYKNSLSFFLLSIIVVSFVIAITTLIYLDRNVLLRLSKLDTEIIDIGKKGSVSSRLSIDMGEDEISSLINSINTMLSKLETSQDKFKKSELKFRSIVELASDGIVLADDNGSIKLCNKGSESIFGYKKDELIGEDISILLPEEFLHLHHMENHNQQNSEIGDTFEAYGYKKDGSKFDLEISHTSWEIKDEKYYCVIVRDITDRKQAENEIKKSLSEKEAMLKEIHHRVKNNMQIISSLLSLQSRYIQNEEAMSVFKDSQNRVKSMALVHEKLYRSEGLAEIDFEEYIKNLVGELFRSYGVNIYRIGLNIESEKIFLDADTAVPCGLIINELVSNSLKYAFNGGDGQIYIKLHHFDDKISLVIGDNGKGLPEVFDLENASTLGLRLVTTLVEQLNGHLEFVNDNGVEFRILFKPRMN